MTGLVAAMLTLAAAAPFALAGDDSSRTAASAVGVQVVVPGASTSSTGGNAVGSYDYRDLVSIGSYTASSNTTASTATAKSSLSSVSLLGGLVTASSVSVSSTAEGEATAHGAFESTVSGLTVGG